MRENLEFGMPKRRRWKRKIACSKEIKFDDVVGILELDALLDRYPGTLSGGEQRRVAIGRAILSQPRLLILDEPLSALDQRLKRKILMYLKKVIDLWHIPTIIITHSKSVVHELTDSVVVLDRGRVISIGSPSFVLPVFSDSKHSIAV